MDTASYPEVQKLLDDLHSHAGAAEIHGTLAGSLCSTGSYRFEDWLSEILPDGHPREGASTLRSLFLRTEEALADAAMDFQPLLPEDAQPIDRRTQALAEWCHGFLYGLGSGPVPDMKQLPGNVGEIVRDFTEITRVDTDLGERSDESDEDAYAELVEFVRVGVQLVFEELDYLRGSPPRVPDTPLH